MLIGSSPVTTAVPDDSRSAEAEAKLEEDLNRFLNLLVTQLKNQDPLDPLDANEFTSQLVQFAGVEQQIFANANLEKLLDLQESNQIASLADFIGNTIEADGKVVPLESNNAEFTYTVPSSAKTVSITITDGTGETVFQTDGDITAGKHTFQWNGKNKSGVDQADGAYNVLVSGVDFAGNLMEITQTVLGRVTGVGVKDGVASLFLGDDIAVFQDRILSVRETKTATP